MSSFIYISSSRFFSSFFSCSLVHLFESFALSCFQFRPFFQICFGPLLPMGSSERRSAQLSALLEQAAQAGAAAALAQFREQSASAVPATSSGGDAGQLLAGADPAIQYVGPAVSAGTSSGAAAAVVSSSPSVSAGVAGVVSAATSAVPPSTSVGLPSSLPGPSGLGLHAPITAEELAARPAEVCTVHQNCLVSLLLFPCVLRFPVLSISGLCCWRRPLCPRVECRTCRFFWVIRPYGSCPVVQFLQSFLVHTCVSRYHRGR